MAKRPKIYTRLTRSAAAVASYKSLWLAADHLLVVSSSGYHEEYRRIQFRDIQGFFTLESERRSSWALVWALVSGVSGLVVAGSFIAGSRPIVSLVFLMLGLAGLVWNHGLGPGCKVYVVTRVQTQILPSLVRRKKTRRVLARLMPLIAEAQRPLVPSPKSEESLAAAAEPPQVP